MFREHDFMESLERSHNASDLPIWEDIYRKAFPNFGNMYDCREDGPHQRQGIDRSITLKNSKQILVDEKVRFRAYNDILLEYWSKERQRVPGWVCKPLFADYIAYAIAPTGKAWLLPVIQMQEAWRRRGEHWIARYGEVRAKNNGYVTVSVAVPERDLMGAIGACLRVTFEPYEDDTLENAKKPVHFTPK